MKKKKKCSCFRKRKHLAYGSIPTKNNWCLGCDANIVPDINKKRERQKTKRTIKKEIDND